MKLFCASMCLLFLLTACGRTTYVNLNKLPDTYQCEHMKDICKEASEFEYNYSKMNKEEQVEFKTLLQTYQDQCNNALDLCKKSK